MSGCSASGGSHGVPGRGLFILSLLLLQGCASLNFFSEPDALLLLPPAPELADQPEKHIVRLNLYGKQVQFLTVSQFTDQESRLMALWPSGQPVIDIRYGVKGFSEQVFGQLPVSGRDVMGVVQFSLWPEHRIKDAYNTDPGWELFLSHSERRLDYNKRPWLKVMMNGDLYQITHYKNDYRVEIQPAGK